MSKTTTYVEFYFRGIMFDDTTVKKTSHRDPRKLKVPPESFGFRFFDVKSIEKDGIKMKSDRFNLSPMYYYGGRIMTLDDVRHEMPDDRILISNMEVNGWSRIIKCRTGNFKPFNDSDVHIKT